MPDEREPILREAEFAESLQQASGRLGSTLARWMVLGSGSFDADLALRIADEAQALEAFLDDHGARQNRTFVLLGELVASLRGLARVRAHHHQLLHRLDRYELLLPAEGLLQDLAAAGHALDAALQQLIQGLVLEAGKHGVSWAPAEQDQATPPSRHRQLPRNLDAETTGDETSQLTTLATRYLAVARVSAQLGLEVKRPSEELAAYVAEHATEDRCRWYESAVHNLQSMYDTHVHGTAVEDQHPWVKALRGHASVAFHLLEMATDLVHFYERHENDIRHEPSQEAIASWVSKQSILDVAVNTCLHHAYAFVEGAEGLANRVLSTFLTQQEVVLSLPDGITLHARPLALIVQVAKHHRTPIEVTIEGQSCSANSLMNLIMLAGQFPTTRELAFRGDVAALQDLRVLFEAGLGESGAPLPDSLPYLRGGPEAG